MLHGDDDPNVPLDVYAAWPEHVRSQPVSRPVIDRAILALIDAREELFARSRCTGQEQPCGNCRSPTAYVGDDGPVCRDGEGCAKVPPLRAARVRAEKRAARLRAKNGKKKAKSRSTQVNV